MISAPTLLMPLRRKLAAGLGVGALALLGSSRRALADTPFTSFGFAATDSPALLTMPNRLAQVKNVMDKGALGDGTGALLSTRYGSLAAAQAVYPFVISTGVTIDWAAITAAVKWNSLFTTATAGTSIGGRIITVASVPAAVQAAPQSYTIKDLNRGTPLLTGLNASLASTTSITITTATDLLIAVVSGDIIEFVPADTGIIEFPFGHYVTNSKIDFDGVGSITFRGAGRGSQISGNFAGFIFDRPGLLASGPGVRVFEKLKVTNTSTSAGAGAIRMLGNDVGAIRDCDIQAHVGVDIGGAAPDATCFDTSIDNCALNGLGTREAGSCGAILGPETAIYDCAVVGFEHGIRAYGAGVGVYGGRIETNKVGIFLGQDAAGVAASVTGAHIFPHSLEANDIGIHASGINASIIGGFSIQGSTNSPSGASTYGIKWDNGTSNIFQAIAISGDSSSFTQNAFYMNPGSTFKGGFESITAGSQVGANWGFTPSPEYTFNQCNNTTNAFAFASLPASPIEGMEFDITDGTNGLAWGDVCTNTGTHTTHYHIRYNGLNWTIVGK